MAKKADFSVPSSMKDVAYRFAVNGETTESLAKWVLDQCPSFLDGAPKEVIAELTAGFLLRKQEITVPQHYKLSDGVFIPVTDTSIEGLITLTPNVVMSYSQHEFTQLGRTDPALQALMKRMRKDCSTYVSNRKESLTKVIKALVSSGTPRTRAVNKGFVEAMETVFDAYDKRVRTAKDRGDPGADPVKYRAARDGFWKIYNT